MLDPRLRFRRSKRGSTPVAGDSASAGGTTVRVGGINQTDYLKAHSLSLRLGSFDFALVNPVDVPVIGAMVYLLEPAWDGQVVSVTHKDVDRGTTKIYSVVATNAKVPVTSAAPFAFSDAPDNVTTFGYRDLTITTAKNDTGNTTRGSFDTYQQGLWPGMTFALTSANFSLSAQVYAVSNVTVTWPALDTNPKFAIEFGDALVGLTQLGTNTGGLSTEPDGTTSLKDPLGNLIFNSASGFGAAWRRFLTSGVYNGDFAAGPPDPSNVIINVTNIMPSWSFLRVGGTGINATWVSDPLQGSGRVIRFTMSPGVADDEVYLEQLIPINASRNRAYTYRVRAYFFNGSESAAGALHVIRHQFMRADGSTPTGTERTTAAAPTVTQDDVTAADPVPADAYFIRVRVGFWRGSAAVGTTAQVDLAEVRLEGGVGTALLTPDDADPGTYGTAMVRQTSGVLELQPTFGASSTVGAVKIATTAKLRFGTTAFPSTPATHDIFYRTDYEQWFFYDGTRWLSTTLYREGFILNDTLQPTAATLTTKAFIPAWNADHDLWVEKLYASTYVATTNSGTQFWTVALLKLDSAFGGTSMGNFTTAADTFNVLTKHTATIGSLLVPGTYPMLDLSLTKTLSPGAITLGAAVTYRLVAT